MGEVSIINDFNFEDFLLFNRIYQVYIRKKGGALVKVKEISSINEKRAKIILEQEKKIKKDMILVFKIKNKIYNISVSVKEDSSQKEFIVINKGKVVCIEERRDYERVEINKKVEYYILNSRPQHFYKGVLEDISASGAKLITNRDINTDYPIILNVFFMNMKLDKLKGKIVWKEEKGREFHNGIEFQFKDKETQEILIDYLY